MAIIPTAGHEPLKFNLGQPSEWVIFSAIARICLRTLAHQFHSCACPRNSKSLLVNE
jgi:hypothetical protein